MILETALLAREAAENPVKVGIVGAGAMGRGIAYQILTSVPGMTVAAVANRTLQRAFQPFAQAGIQDVVAVKSANDLDDCIRRRAYAVTDDAGILCASDGIDVVFEITGDVEFGAHVATEAIRHGKHVILMNSELDATLGPILQVHAAKAGVVYSNSDGDQPGVIMNLHRYVAMLGCRPVLAGNMKGLQDPYRTPETQRQFARQYNLKPEMATAFADGTKISLEMAVVANATRFKAGKRGMFGFECGHVKEALTLYPMDQLLNGGLVDYVLGAAPAGGVFVIGYHDDPLQQQYLRYYKMGDGPLYMFYQPYHLCHLEAPASAARAVLFNDAVIAPCGAPVCDVLTVAKRDLRTGETLDRIGGFTFYGMLDNAATVQSEKLLPVGLAPGCRLRCDVARDTPIRVQDVTRPRGRLCDRLRDEQEQFFAEALTA